MTQAEKNKKRLERRKRAKLKTQPNNPTSIASSHYDTTEGTIQTYTKVSGTITITRY